MSLLSVKFEELKTSTFAYREERCQPIEPQVLLNSVISLLDSVTLVVMRTPKSDVKLFVDKNKGAIYRVYYILAKESKLYVSDKSQQTDIIAKVLHLMNVLHIMNVQKFFGRLPTDYLTDFCKGITYFEGDKISEYPLSKLSQADKSSVYKCYLERTIYDRLLTDILHYQDPRHLAELKKMEYYYQDYFPEWRLTVFITYKNEIEPVSLILTTYTNENARDKIEERYDKTASKLVKCTKAVFKDEKRVAYYTKEQTEDREEEWIELTLGTLLKHTTSASTTKTKKKN